jgi:NADH:ubiquinone oxidoreductase subunit C
LQEFADRVADAVGGTAEIQFDTVKVRISPDSWVEAHTIARDELDLVFFSWLSAIDWANEVASGDSLKDEVDERIELMSALSDLTEGMIVILSTDLSSDQPQIASLVDVYAGPTGTSAKPMRCSASTSRATPTQFTSTCPTRSRAIPFARAFLCSAGR